MGRRRTVVAAAAAVLVAAGAVVALTRDDDADPTPSASPSPTEASTEPTPDPEPHVEAALTIDQRATDAAMEAMADGGTAADAAVAAAAVLSVVEPYYSNVIGGETSALYYDASEGETRSLEAVGPVGSDFDLDAYRGGTPFGLDQVIVPGAWDGWMVLLAEQGALDVSRVLEPAIALARDGHEATDELATQVRSALASSSINAAARAVYAPGGDPVDAGDTVVQADFARTLQRVADAADRAEDRAAGIEAARDAVYGGAVGDDLLAAARDGGATFTAADLADFEAVLLDSISIEYDDVTVHQNPPTSQGLTMLMALNILEKADLQPEDADDPDAAHLTVEALKLAMADREEWVGDPAFTDVPVEELLSDEYAQSQLDRIDPGSALDPPIASGLENTTTFQVVDGRGDAVAVTTSTGYQLMQAGGTGVMLNNRLRYMTATDPGSPNFVEPGKKVRYTGNPYLVTDDDGLRFLGGVIGSDTQAQVQAQHVVSVLDLGMGAVEAVGRHRFVTQSTPTSIAPHGTSNQLRVEQSTPGPIVDALRSRGQQVSLLSGAGPFGYGSMILVADDGRSAELGLEPRVPRSSGEQRLRED